jgi:hypothetical protein
MDKFEARSSFAHLERSRNIEALSLSSILQPFPLFKYSGRFQKVLSAFRIRFLQTMSPYQFIQDF